MRVKVRKITDKRIDIMRFQQNFNKIFWRGHRANKHFPLFGDLAYNPNIINDDRNKIDTAMKRINDLKKEIRANHQENKRI